MLHVARILSQKRWSNPILLGEAGVGENGNRPEGVKLAEARRGFVLLPKRWVVGRSFGWAARLRLLSRDCERLASSLEGLHWLAFATLMRNSFFRWQSSVQAARAFYRKL